MIQVSNGGVGQDSYVRVEWFFWVIYDSIEVGIICKIEIVMVNMCFVVDEVVIIGKSDYGWYNMF